jgi:cytochrome c biogenesis protein CcdA
MAGEVLNPLLGFGAGVLTILSPCVLPLVPVVLGAAAQRHRLGPLALSAGLVGSFTVIGFTVAAFGASIGIDAGGLRRIGAAVLVLAGMLLLAPRTQAALATAAGPLANWANARQDGLERYGLAGQAGIGVLLGLVWSPCVGPTLGAATALAAQGEQLPQVALTMAAFGAGIASVLLVLATAGRVLFARWRGRLMGAGKQGKRVLGAVLLVVGAAILTGFDRTLESVLVAASPDWLVEWSTRF